MELKRILVLCGGKFAFPSLQQLGLEKFLCGVGIGKGEPNIVSVLENESENTGLPFLSFPDRQSLTGLRSWIDELKPDYIFSISFPFLLSEEVLAYGNDRFINFHPGPLPNYRGPMPLFEVLRYQEKETAISVHFMNEAFDEGALILKESIAIQEEDTYGGLAAKLSERTAYVVLNMAQMLQFGSTVPRQEQNAHEARYFEKPELEDTCIQWNRMSADEILALIRACNPWNQGADAFLKNQQVKLIAAAHSEETHTVTPGTILGLTAIGGLSVACINNKVIDIYIIGNDNGILTGKQFFNLKHRISYFFN